VTTVVLDVHLTAEDRCDRCGAKAAKATRLGSGAVLYWCVHHWRKHKDALERQTAAAP
jgi:hypothetical protein